MTIYPYSGRGLGHSTSWILEISYNIWKTLQDTKLQRNTNRQLFGLSNGTNNNNLQWAWRPLLLTQRPTTRQTWYSLITLVPILCTGNKHKAYMMVAITNLSSTLLSFIISAACLRLPVITFNDVSCQFLCHCRLWMRERGMVYIVNVLQSQQLTQMKPKRTYQIQTTSETRTPFDTGSNFLISIICHTSPSLTLSAIS